MKMKRGVAAVIAGIALLATGCGSSSKSNAGGGGAGGEPTYTVGVLGDLTGPASGTSHDMHYAIAAGAGVAATEGYKIKYVMADTESSPSGALAAAQRLVAKDHVFAVIAISDLTFAAAPYLASKHIPVIGAAVDGPEWNTDSNMFSVFGAPDYTKVTTTAGKAFKLMGAKNVAALGYGEVPSAAEGTRAAAISAQAAGLKAGYVNAEFPLGSTNVAPIALAMKQAGVDAVDLAVQQNTGFALVGVLKQEGVQVKAVYGAGYGSDLLEAGPASEQAAQGGYFPSTYEPIEMHTAATEKFANAMKTYANYTMDPGFNEYIAYVTMDALVDGLKAAGPNPSQAKLINAMLGITDYNAAGLWGSHTMSFAMSARGQGGGGADNCEWLTQFEGTSFHLVPGGDPVCGTVIPGKKVSAS